MFEPIERQSLSQSVYERLRDGIVSGELGSGTKLPSERGLAEALGVNRGAVREALKRLEQARLVSIRQGGAARVLDYQSTAGMDLLSELLFANGDLDLWVARSVIEMRACLGPEIARRCAERGGVECADRLHAGVEAMAADEDLDRRQAASLEFWAILVEGSRNVAYRLAYNSLRASYDTFRAALVQVMGAELRSIDSFRAVVDAVRQGDGDAAARRASELLELGARGLYEMLDTLQAFREGETS
ncbi:MAG: FadR family transcriptional regulator [Planctomycetes bacterium]|nr:FadR family transcriptional regulator [Planctomycetota bacterium]